MTARQRFSTFRLAVGLAAAMVMRVGAADSDRFFGGSYDGWDQQAMTNETPLGAQVTLSSGAAQLFEWRQVTATLLPFTIRDDDPAAISNGMTLVVSLPAALHLCFDTNLNPTYSGSAAGKVAAASFSSDRQTLRIPVTEDFLAHDELIVTGAALKATDLRLALVGISRLALDFDGGSVPDLYDEYTLQLRVQQVGGAYDGWDSNNTANSYPLVPSRMILKTY